MTFLNQCGNSSMKWKWLMVLGLSLVVSTEARAGLVRLGSGVVDNKNVSARAEFNVDSSGNLVITLQNTATANDYTMSHVLTDVEFDISGVTFGAAGSSVVVATDSILDWRDSSKADTPGPFDISSEWALGNSVQIAGVSGTFDYGVSATAFVSSQSSTILGSTDLGGSNGINGGDFGLMNYASRTHNGIKNNDIVTSINDTPTVLITLVPTSGTVDLNNITRVAFSYGSAQDGIVGVVPAPAGIVLMSLGGVMLGGMQFYRKKKEKKE